MIELPDLPQPQQHADLREWAERVTVALRQFQDALRDGAPWLSLEGGALSGDLTLREAEPVLWFNDTDGPADKKILANFLRNGVLYWEVFNDAGVYLRDLLGLNVDGGVFIGQWTTASRPAGANGLMGFNTTTSHFEVFIAGEWRTLQDNRGTGTWRGSASNVGFVDIGFPAGVDHVRVRGWWHPVASGDNLLVRVSHDGGATFKAGAADYRQSYMQRNGAVVSAAGVSAASFVYVAAGNNWGERYPFDLAVTSGWTPGGFGSIQAHGMGFNATNTQHLWVDALRDSVDTINAIRLLCTTNNILNIKYTVEYF